ncbi:MAG: hypothetical protein ACKVP7_20460 [Hyphomicrobiaceae bacterium]
MLEHHTAPPDGVHLLADHLDAALAAGEDLMAAHLKPAADTAEGEAPEDLLAAFVGEVRQYEAALLLRLLQARRRAETIKTADAGVRSVLRLVAANTTALLELVQLYGDGAASAAAGHEDLQQFLRRRGLIADDAPGVGVFETLRIGDDYRVGGVIPLGGLLDMAAAALDLLDRQFELYKDGDELVEPGTERAANTTNASETDVDIAPSSIEVPVEAVPVMETADDRPSPGSLRAALKELSEAT